MQKRHIVYNIQGMGLDVVSSPQNTTMAYSIKNMRLTPTKNSNALELTTERGTLLISVTGDALPSGATVLGYCTLLDYLVLFIKTSLYDYIFRLQQTNNGYTSKKLFQGNLNFDINSNIEATSYYENANVLKVYWVDGVNQPRMINIFNEVDGISSDPYTGFDFLQSVLQRNSSARIFAKKIYTGGSFTAGVIQYAYSLYSINSQETPLLDITSLNYITNSDRGGAPNELCNCSFEITIQNDNLLNEDRFDYIRVYSILRNSLNGTPLARVVADVPFANNITIIDDGNGGYDIDYNQLQYQRLPIYPLTLTLKDNVLFIGNYNIDNTVQEQTQLYKLNNDELPILTEKWQVGQDDLNYKVDVYNTNDISVYPWKNQLNTESAGVKTFKHGEIYKIGVLFQDKYGNWSLPYFIRDVQQDKYPDIYNGVLEKPIFKCKVKDIFDNLQNWEKQLYIRIRPVVSFPSLSERSILYQGVLNPTIFNLTDRVNKTSYSLSSWFFRPEINIAFNLNETYGQLPYGAITEFQHYKSLLCSDDIGSEIQGMFFDDYASNVFYPLNNRYNCRYSENGTPLRPRVDADDILDDDISKYKNFYFVDKSIITFNSPDIEFNKINNEIPEDVSVDISGYIQLQANSGKYKIISQNPNFLLSYTNDDIIIRSEYLADGNKYFGVLNSYDESNINLSYGILGSSNFWFDDFSVKPYPDLGEYSNANMLKLISYDQNNNTYTVTNKWNYPRQLYSFMVYPWLRLYLNNYKADSVDSETSKITLKYLANFRYSVDTNYLNQPETLDTKQITYCNRDLSKLKDNKYYSANYNRYLTYNSQYLGFVTPYDYESYWNPLTTKGWLVKTGYPIMIKGFFTFDMQKIEDNLNPGETQNWGPTDNFVIGYFDNYKSFINLSKVHPIEIEVAGTCLYGYDYIEHYPESTLQPDEFTSETNAIPQSQDDILIQYKSNNHLVIQLNDIEYNNEMYHLLLPTLSGLNQTYTQYNNKLCWCDDNDLSYDGNIVGSYQKHLNINDKNGYLLIADIKQPISLTYLNTWNTDDPDNPYLENQSNLYLRSWLPCGKTISIPDIPDNEYIRWIEGDTYYQRYDCVKTKPYSEDDYQSVIEILSFMVESNINLDGRYDKNRGILDYTIISDENFNLFNDVYNQENNFFTYHILDPAKFNVDEFRNDIVWSLKKVSGESIDQWTKLSSVNQLQLDGNKGHVKALRKFNNHIYCFQDHAVSRIRFNDRTAISTTDGVPLQLAYTNYVDGYEYVNSDIGCQYGISCCESENGIFFIDNDIPGIYKMSYNEYGNINVRSLTKEKFMQRWFENIGNVSKTRIFFDKPVNEILTLNNRTLPSVLNGYCLSFSNDMGSFQQFIDYDKAQYILTHNNWPVAITNIQGNLELWKLRNGSFVSFFGQDRKPYGLKFIASPPRTNEGLIVDCIYDNLSYKADVFTGPNGDDENLGSYSYQADESFDSIDVYSIYQNSDEESLNYTNQPHHSISNLRKKFGAWFAKIPRFNNISLQQGRYNKERMRGSKLMINLMKNYPNITNNKLILKELSVDCFY